MVAIDVKDEIYQLIIRYLSDTITVQVFCDSFYREYDLELDSNTLTEHEKHVFASLNDVVSRFTDSENDLRNYPDVYYGQSQLTQQVREAAASLTITR
jgi:hypothetical protein